jgi:hypothetical protein
VKPDSEPTSKTRLAETILCPQELEEGKVSFPLFDFTACLIQVRKSIEAQKL